MTERKVQSRHDIIKALGLLRDGAVLYRMTPRQDLVTTVIASPSRAGSTWIYLEAAPSASACKMEHTGQVDRRSPHE
jgi:hypothetical protein